MVVVVSILAALIAVWPARAVDFFAAGDALYGVDPVGASILCRSEPLPATASDVEVDPHGRYVAVTTAAGLTLHDLECAPIGVLELGVLDCVELSPDGETIYVLVHPAARRRDVGGQHRLLAIPFAEPREPVEVCRVGALSYDMFLSTDGSTLVITNNIGRDVDVVDVASGSVRTLTIAAGAEPENELAVLRAGLWDGARFRLGESARTRKLILWDIDVASGTMTKAEQPWRMHALGLERVGDVLVVNGLDRIAWGPWSSSGLDEERDVLRDVTGIAAFSRDGSSPEAYLIAPAADGSHLMRLRGGTVEEVLTLPGKVTTLVSAPGATSPAATPVEP